VAKRAWSPSLLTLSPVRLDAYRFIPERGKIKILDRSGICPSMASLPYATIPRPGSGDLWATSHP